MTVSQQENTAFFQLCSFITGQWGLDFGENREEQIFRAVQTRMEELGLASAFDYSRLLIRSDQREQESRNLLDLITVNETFFFRHKAQFDLLRDHCLPAILKRNSPTKRIRIWSAACSTGEEPYSIAMILRELLPESSGWKVVVRGTDISTRTLLKARKGLYGKRSIEHMEPRFRDRYVTRKGNRYALSPEIRSAVQFEYFNLACDPFPPDAGPPWDIIFCRNVMIYFTREHARRLLHNLHLHLADHGFLFTGHSEMLSFLYDGFEPVEINGTFIYRKKTGKRKIQAVTGGLAAQKATRKNKPPVVPKIRRKAPAGGPATAKPPGNRDRKKGTVPAARQETGAGVTGGDPGRYEARIVQSKKLADRGETQRSVEILGELTEESPLRPEAYFLLAMISLDMGDLDQSILYLKKVVYLETNDPVARMYLAEAYREKGKASDAIREYSNAIEFLEQDPEGPLGTHAAGFTRGALLETARGHLNAMPPCKK